MSTMQTQGGAHMALQETLVGGLLSFLGAIVLAVTGAVINLFFRVVRLETNRERDAELLSEIRGDVKKLLAANGVPDGND